MRNIVLWPDFQTYQAPVFSLNSVIVGAMRLWFFQKCAYAGNSTIYYVWIERELNAYHILFVVVSELSDLDHKVAPISDSTIKITLVFIHLLNTSRKKIYNGNTERLFIIAGLSLTATILISNYKYVDYSLGKVFLEAFLCLI